MNTEGDKSNGNDDMIMYVALAECLATQPRNAKTRSILGGLPAPVMEMLIGYALCSTYQQIIRRKQKSLVSDSSIRFSFDDMWYTAEIARLEEIRLQTYDELMAVWSNYK